jgi:hypothetical protein
VNNWINQNFGEKKKKGEKRSMDARSREVQKKLVITLVSLVVVRFFLTRGFSWLRAWWQKRDRQREELEKLMLRTRRNELKAKTEELERELAEEEMLSAERKNSVKRSDGTVSQQKATFQFPKASASDREDSVERRGTPTPSPAPVPAPAPSRAMTAPSRASNPWANLEPPASSPAPSRASNPWANLEPPASSPAPARRDSFAAERRAQDAEYEESLRVDKARQEVKEEVARKAREANDVKESLRCIVPSDPGESSGEELIHISFKLRGFGVKDSVAFTRRFRKETETTTDVITFWKAHGLVEADEMERIEICTSYPGHPIEPGKALSEFSSKEVFVVRLK